MAAKTKVSSLTLGEGQYFTANYNRKKIRGTVIESDAFVFALCNNKEGESACNDDADGFGYSISIDVEDYDNHEEALKDHGITSFAVCNDKRQKAIIDTDKMPEFIDWKVRNVGNSLVFGCGSVTLTKAQIKGWVAYRRAIVELDGDGIADNIGRVEDAKDLECVGIEIFQRAVDYLKAKKAISKPVVEAYEAVKRVATSEIHIDDFNDISIEDVEELLSNF